MTISANFKTYSVAEAKSGLPSLIDRVVAGEEVIITRHGRAVVEVIPALPRSRVTADRAANSAWLSDRRRARKSISVDSLEVLHAEADETAW